MAMSPPTEGKRAGGALTDKDPKSLWFIHGEAYDLSTFIHSHPGGYDAIMLGRGRDCTALFESYHPFTDRPAAILPKFKVAVAADVLSGHCIDTTTRGFFRLSHEGSRKPDPFWAALCSRCGEQMKQQGHRRTMSWPLFAVFLGIAAVQAALFVFGYLRGSYLAAIALGASSWLLMTPGHEGVHYAVSDRPLVNKVVGYWSMFGLTNPAMWEQQHNYAHHSFTNDYTMDPDLRAFSQVLRFHSDGVYKQRHGLQLYDPYVWFCLCLTVMGLCVRVPIGVILSGNILDITSISSVHRSIYLSMALHLVSFYVLICLPRKWFPGFPLDVSEVGLSLTYLFSAGGLFGFFAAVSHLSEPSMAATEKATGWAQQQVETASNFRVDSLFWAVVSGGGSVQIEHHLFPGLSVEALVALSPTVRQTCAEFDVEYKCHQGYLGLLADLMVYLKPLSIRRPELCTTAATMVRAGVERESEPLTQ